MSLIAADNTFALAAFLLALVAFGFWAETRHWGRKLSGALIILLGAALASNLHLVPHEAPIYGTMAGVLVPLAIPLLLFRADLARVLRETGPVLKAFLISVALTVIGALVGALLFDPPEQAKVAGVMTASYIGGSVNFVATAEAVELTDQSVYVTTLAADVIGAVYFLAILMLLPASALIRRAMPSSYLRGDETPGAPVDQPEVSPSAQETATFDLVGASLALATSAVICGLSHAFVVWIDQPQLFIVMLTIIALAVANLARPLVRRFSADFAIGTYLMYAFFAAIGAGADLPAVLVNAPATLAFILTLVTTHLILLLCIGRALRLDLAEVMVAANACILGPATAAAMAAGQGWRPLVTPGLLVGILGYAIGTFCGIGVTALLS